MEAEGVILGLVPFEGLDEQFVTVYYAHDDDPDTVLQAQMPLRSLYPRPHVNDRIRIHYRLQVPTRIERLDDAPRPDAASAPDAT
jgi:hypothetical protein